MAVELSIDPAVRLQSSQLLADTAREFHTRGWMFGTSGNLSVRLQADPLAFLVTASGRDKGRLVAEDMLLVGADGAPLEVWKGKPSAEMPVHERIYRLCDAGAVYHVHSVTGAVLSDVFAHEGGIPYAGLEMLKGLGHPAPDIALRIPIADNHADSLVIADNLERALDPAVPGVFIRNHGLYAWGKTPRDAHNHVEVFEYLFRYAQERRAWA
jgi:methylthioribulose-1-phosphate dehydratase